MDALRPETFDDYHGQDKLKEVLEVHINGSVERCEPLEHVLLYGPPGCGKTTIAKIIAEMVMADFASYIMPIKEQLLKRIVTSFDGVVLFDELHRLTPRQQEWLLPLIEDNYIQTENGAILHTGALTVIGATTELDKVISPLWDRFQIKPPFDAYTDQEMAEIVTGMANKVGIELDNESALVFGRATGGVPRNAKAIVSMARDMNSTDVDAVLDMCRLTRDGLTELHRRYLFVLADCGGTSGLEIIGAHLGLPKSTLINLETLLTQRNMIEYTKQGRSLLSAGWKLTKGTH